jgi:S1-C subfamily serine protease
VPADLPVNVIDMAAILVIGLAIYGGFRSGFVIQALAIVGLAAGIGLLIVSGPFLADALAEFEGQTRTLATLGAMAAIVLIAQAIGSATGKLLRRQIGDGVLSSVDHGAGAGFGFARGVFIVWLLAGLLTVLPFSSLAVEARGSLVLRAIETRLPSPVALAGELARVLAAAGLPDIFAGAPPAPGQRADTPATAEAQRLAATALGSTYRVEALACGQFLTGSSFAVNGNHLVTNAHVVAGASEVWISQQGSLDRWTGRVVVFDAQLDAALIYVRGLGAAALQLADSAPGRGSSAVALGYTGGGPLQVIPAGVNRTIEALGRDLYGRGAVSREVIELNADVAPGDSGGPLVIAGGIVGGVTFSESQTDPSIGYALTPDAVAGAITGARDSTAAADTGACIH